MVSQMEGIINKVNSIILRSSAPSERSPTSAWKELTFSNAKSLESFQESGDIHVGDFKLYVTKIRESPPFQRQQPAEWGDRVCKSVTRGGEQGRFYPSWISPSWISLGFCPSFSPWVVLRFSHQKELVLPPLPSTVLPVLTTLLRVRATPPAAPPTAPPCPATTGTVLYLLHHT